MRKLLSILFIGALLSGCAGSRGCGCPNWGSIGVEAAQPQVALQSEFVKVNKECL